MNGYAWCSNQHQPPPYHQRDAQRYNDRPTPQHRERVQPHYQAVRNNQPNSVQGWVSNPQHTSMQMRHSSGHQNATNQWSSYSGSTESFAPAHQPNSHGYNMQTNQNRSQYPFTEPKPHQHYQSENPEAYRNFTQFSSQSHVSSTLHYRNNECSQAPMYWTPQSDGRGWNNQTQSDGRGWNNQTQSDGRGWNNQNSRNDNSCFINNQQHIQHSTTPSRNAQQHQQFIGQRERSGIQHMHHKSQTHHMQSSSWTLNNGVSHTLPNNQAPVPTVASSTSLTSPCGVQNSISLPSSNLNQRPVNQYQPELRMNAGPAALVSQFDNNQSIDVQSQCSSTVNNQTSQTNENQLQTHSRAGQATPSLYRLLCSKKQSNERTAHTDSSPVVCTTNMTEQNLKGTLSEPTVEPPSKRINDCELQRDYWSKDAVMPTGAHQTCNNNIRARGTSHRIQYSTDPADCLEAVFALQKAQQVHKAIAIVSPISLKALPDSSPKKADSPPLKIDSVYSISEEADAEKAINDKLPETPSPTEKESLENETTHKTTVAETCSTMPAELEKGQQGELSDTSFNLSSVPVVKHTLAKLMDLVDHLEKELPPSTYPQNSGSAHDEVLKLYWKGSEINLLEPYRKFEEEMDTFIKYIKRDSESMVFESIESENLKKLKYCEVLSNEVYSSPEEFKSSWLNVEEQIDIDKVLSEPLLDDTTGFEGISQILSVNTSASSASLNVSSREVSLNENGVKPTPLSTRQTGNDKEQMVAENNGHSNSELSSVTLPSSLSSEVLKKRESIKQDYSFNTEPSNASMSADDSLEKHTDCVIERAIFRKDNSEQKSDGVFVSDSCLLSPLDRCVDGGKSSAMSLSPEVLSNSQDAQQVGGISYNESSSQALEKSSDICVFEDISDDKASRNEVSPGITSVIWQVEDISDENPDSEDTLNKSTDECVVVDVSNDESSDDCLLMEITVLSSEDAKTIFQQLDPECTIKPTQSYCTDLLAPRHPNHDHRKTAACSCCGAKVAISKSASGTQTDSNVELFCVKCWEQAPLLELERETDILGSSAESNTQEQNRSPPHLQLEVIESNMPSTRGFFEEERLTRQRCDLESEPGQTCSPLSLEPKEPRVTSPEMDEGVKGQNRQNMVKSDLEDNSCPPCINLSFSESDVAQNSSPPAIQLQAKSPNVDVPDKCTESKKLQVQTSERFSQLNLSQNSCIAPPPELQDKVSNVAFPEKCIENESHTGTSLLQSELRQNCRSSEELQAKVPKIASPQKDPENERLTEQTNRLLLNSELRQNCVASDELQAKVTIASPVRNTDNDGMTGQPSGRLLQSKLRQSCSPPSAKLKDNVPNALSSEVNLADRGSNEEKSPGMVKSMTFQTKSEIQKSTERKLTKILRKNQKNEKMENLKLSKPQPPSAKPTSLKLRLKKFSSCDDEVLFAPDIVVKKNWPQKRNLSGDLNKCSNNDRKVKKTEENGQDGPKRNLTESQQNETKNTPLRESVMKPELHCISKTMTPESKKMRFDLYGSKREQQFYATERRFSAPASLTINNGRKDYSDVLSAKQKVLNEWSITFIPTKSKQRTPKDGTQKKKKLQKPAKVLKSNMSALKKHMTQRAKLLSSSKSS